MYWLIKLFCGTVITYLVTDSSYCLQIWQHQATSKISAPGHYPFKVWYIYIYIYIYILYIYITYIIVYIYIYIYVCHSIQQLQNCRKFTWQILFPNILETVQTSSKMFSWEFFENFQRQLFFGTTSGRLLLQSS